MPKKKEKIFIPKGIGMTKKQIADGIGFDWWWLIANKVNGLDRDEEPPTLPITIQDKIVRALKLPDGFCRGYVDNIQEILEDFQEDDRGDAEYDMLPDLVKEYPELVKQLEPFTKM